VTAPSDVEAKPWQRDPGRIFTEPAAYADFDAWHEVAMQLRNAGPLYRVELPDRQPFWAVLRHAEVHDVERDAERFTNGPSPVIAPFRPLPGEAPVPVKPVIMLDGDEHRRQRGVLKDWFKPGRIRTMSDAIEKLARTSVDEMLARDGHCDFALDVAAQFPLRVILSTLGLPESDYARMLRLTQELFGADDPDYSRVTSDDQMLEVIMDFFAYFSGITAERRAAPGTDLASWIANAEIDGVPLDDMQAFAHYLIVATAGHDTTSSAIAGGMLALLQHPDQMARLREDPSLIDNAADEILRWVTPVKHFMRTAQTDTELAGVAVAEGDWLLLSYPSANRDERVFTEPFRFDVARPDAEKHLSFGFGAHYCLGTHLARLEIRTFFRELLRRVEDIELDGEPALMEALLVSGPKQLPIRYRPVR
jgi:cytochrome P450